MKSTIEALARATSQDWRTANGVNKGTVHQVDAQRGMARLRLGGTDEKPFLGPWVPYMQTMGALKFHNPPSVGQQMFMVSTGGDYEQGVLIPLAQSNQNRSPSDKPDEHVLTLGSAKLELRGDELVVTIPKVRIVCGDTSFELTAAGLNLTAAAVDVHGDALTHNAKNVGHDHAHTQVEPGSGLSGPPE